MLPYPILTFSLVVMWLLLNSFTLGHVILGSVVAVFAGWAMASLRPEKPRLGKVVSLAQAVCGSCFVDIVKSNIAVAGIILRSGARRHNPGFITVHLDIRSQFALAVLAVILTSTPGSAWLEYDSNDHSCFCMCSTSERGDLACHDQNRYEKLLLEIFV
jgi:multicomponent K+:H+ antiporter subunit E